MKLIDYKWSLVQAETRWPVFLCSPPWISSTSPQDNHVFASMLHISLFPELDLPMRVASSSLICPSVNLGNGNSGREEAGEQLLSQQPIITWKKRLTLKTAEMRVNWDCTQLLQALSCELSPPWQAAHCISHHASDRSFRNTKHK